MSKLPIRRAQFDLQGFATWLALNGAEIRQQTNPYEVVRYLAFTPGSSKALTHIVYAKESGLLTFTGSSRNHYQAMLDGKNVPGMFVSKHDRVSNKAPKPKGRTSAETRAKLLDRDGGACWFCGITLADDCTIEHLVPKSKGGGNKLDNYALAHAKCNADAADKPLVEKIEMRAILRAKLQVLA